MNRRIRSLALLASIALGAVSSADEPLRVVATIPDLADICGEIGGDRVDVSSLARGTENIHSVALRPTALIRINKADLFLEMGLSLEHAYVPGLLEAARNPRIRPGSPGFVNCSEGWSPVEVPAELTRAKGTDLHPLGNPHFNLDPRGGRHIADRVLAALIAVDPEHRADYEARHAAYGERLAAAEQRWSELAAKLAGKRIVTYHREFSYLAAATGLEVVDEIEARPGVSPTPRELARVIGAMKERDVGVVLTARWSNNKHVRFVAEKTGATVVEVPTMVGGSKAAGTWIGLMDELYGKLAAAFKTGG
jgi:ABC-type Zn uptake system ZnuABC Zn-binding protein ZnuA